jgi:multiple sugar transport system permease protein
LSLPGVITAVLFGVILAWDEFLYALIFTSSVAAKTLPVAISEFTSRHAVDYGLIAAGGIVAALPPLILAFALQRYLIAGLTAGSVKG